MRLKPLSLLGLLMVFLIPLQAYPWGSPKPKPAPAPAPIPKKITSLGFTTYNLGLAYSYVPYAKERVPKLLKAIKNHKTDVLCLQEVWNKSDQDSVRNSLSSLYPHHMTSPIKQARRGGWFSGPSCKVTNLFGSGKFVSCIRNTCGDLNGEEYDKCVNNDCRPSLDALAKNRPQCAEALMAQVGKNQILAIFELLNPFRPAGRFTYNGSVGTMMFSKHPFTNKGFVSLSNQSTLNNRGILWANIKVNGKEKFVACTHLTANLIASAPYPNKPPISGGGFKTGWENENYYQMKVLRDQAESKARGSTRVLMGDFNCGPDNSSLGIAGDFQKSCQYIRGKNYAAPFITQNPSCTYCKDNQLTSGKDPDMILDHVFLKNAGRVSDFKSERVFNQEVSINPEEGSMDVPLSDHYGVKVTIPVK